MRHVLQLHRRADIVSNSGFALGRQSNPRNSWSCSGYRWSPRSRHLSLGPTSLVKPYYITSPIFYVNAAPHVGHLFTLVLTDILKRWQIFQGRKAILCTGTDEHGMKIQQAAAKAKSDEKSFCDRGANVFKQLAREADVLNDHFVRTTDNDHKEAVEYFWEMLQERGYIYTSKHEGWYSVSDETFYPQSAVHLVLDPRTGRKMMTSMETGKEVEWTSESNYHFRLSAFRERLLKFYHENPKFVVPAVRLEDVVQDVQSGLEDLSISRPVERLSWGIRVPGDDTQTIYVWLDALINYITKAGYPWAPGREHERGWPADCQVIGKDIVRFHCIYWPAFLLALDLPPPRQVLTHAHWTLGRAKMSKSTGNVVNPFFALDRFGVDVMRFYLAHDGGIVDDADYGNLFIIERYKKALQGGLGNLSSRVTRGKGWSVRRAVERASQSPISAEGEDEPMAKQIRRLQDLPGIVDQCLSKDLDPGAGLKAIMRLVYETNKFLHHASPWTLVQQQQQQSTEHPSSSAAAAAAARDPSTEARVDAIIYLCAESLRLTGLLLQPYMPSKAAQLLDMLGVDESQRTWAQARLGADTEYGESKVPLGKGHAGVLFPPLGSDA